MNIVQTLYAHVCKWKNDTLETIPGMRRKEKKENSEEDEFKYDIFDIL
jgi:hypothetical protein